MLTYTRCSVLQGLVSFALQRYDQAMGHFVSAVQTSPNTSGATVRMAVALCCFKLEQFDRARIALEKCLSVDVSKAYATLVFILLVLLLLNKSNIPLLLHSQLSDPLSF